MERVELVRRDAVQPWRARNCSTACISGTGMTGLEGQCKVGRSPFGTRRKLTGLFTSLSNSRPLGSWFRDGSAYRIDNRTIGAGGKLAAGATESFSGPPGLETWITPCF